MNSQQLINFQEDGESDTATLANYAIQAARNSTPEAVRHQFRSFIRWNGTKYAWGWILKA